MKTSKNIIIALLLLVFVPASAQKTKNMENGLEYVDLGLSVNWATYNVGADKPEDSGDYYAWGETVPKSYYSEFSYKWCDSVLYNSLNKYNSIDKCGKVDHLETLEPADDVAHFKWGGQWRIPTKAEFEELIENCSWTWTTINNVNGYRVTSKKAGYTNRSIFLPAAGGFSYSNINVFNSYGGYSSSSLNPEYPGFNYYLGFGSRNQYVTHDYRFVGRSVRPVCPKEEINMDDFEGQEDILRKKEYTLQEWYDLNPSLYSLLLKPTAGEFSTKSEKASYVETKSVRKSRDRQVRQLLDEGAIVNKFEPVRVSSFRDRDGYLLSKETDFGKLEDGDSIVIYLPISITFNGTLTIRLDSEFGPIIGHFDFTKKDRRNKLIESCVLDYGNISGRHDVYFFYPYEYNGHNLSGFPSRDRWYLKRF